jgi:methionine sulfoxide reductase heme-binding subunit
VLRIVLNSRWFLWALLALPALAMLSGYARGEIDPADLLHPTGEFSARFMIVAMAIAPLIAVIGTRHWLQWLAARRRWLGVAAFSYAVLHLIFYLIDMGNLADILAEIGALGIWTGWAAMLLMLPLALTSNDAAMRALKSAWKRVQRLAWPAALLTLVHWIFVHNNIGPALVHFAPLALLFLLRLFRISLPQRQGV